MKAPVHPDDSFWCVQGLGNHFFNGRGCPGVRGRRQRCSLSSLGLPGFIWSTHELGDVWWEEAAELSPDAQHPSGHLDVGKYPRIPLMCFLWLCSKQVFSTNFSSHPNGTEFPSVVFQFQAVHPAALGLHGDCCCLAKSKQ